MTDDMIDVVKTAIAEKFAPAINFNAPYAKVMLDYAAKAVLEAFNQRDMESRS